MTIRCIPLESKPATGRASSRANQAPSKRCGRNRIERFLALEHLSMSFILVINCGSSSLKFSIIDPENGKAEIQGLAERLSSPDARVRQNSPAAKAMKHRCLTLVTVKYSMKFSMRWAG